MKKLTIIGDIMCEPPVFRQAAKEDGTYNFLPAFTHLKPLLSEADYVIGNLETPLAGESLGYTTRLVSFNAPDTLAEMCREIGVDMVSTANNHACDRGNEGIRNTIEALDRIGLAHTGTYVNYRKDDPGRIFYFELGGAKIALIAYTYGTNYGINGNEPDEAAGVHVNYLRPCTAKEPLGTRNFPESYRKVLAVMEKFAGRKPLWEDEVDVRNALGISNAYADDCLFPEISEECLENVKADYEEARKNADYVFILPHMGGQFNVKPGAFSNYMMHEFVKMGFDGVFAAHSHTLQQAKIYEGKPCYWSLGNVSMAPFSPYAVRETLPEFAVAAHIYIEEGKIVKNTFSLTKIIEEENGLITVYPVEDLYRRYVEAGKEEVTAPGFAAEAEVKVTGAEAAEILYEEAEEIYLRVTGRDFPGIKHEYEL